MSTEDRGPSREEDETVDRQEASAAPDGAADLARQWAELRRRGLELGGRAAREIGGGRYGLPSIGRDLQDWADLRRGYGRALLSLWSGAAVGGGPEEPGTREPGENPTERRLRQLGVRLQELEAAGVSKSDLQEIEECLRRDLVSRSALDDEMRSLLGRLASLEGAAPRKRGWRRWALPLAAALLASLALLSTIAVGRRLAGHGHPAQGTVTKAELDSAMRRFDERFTALGKPPASDRLEALATRVNELASSRATKTELKAIADRVPQNAVERAELAAAVRRLHEELEPQGPVPDPAEQLEKLDRRVAALDRRVAALEQGDQTSVGSLVSSSLQTLAARRRKLQAEQTAGDLHRALFPDREPSDTKMARISEQLAAAKLEGGLAMVIEDLVSEIDPAPRKSDWATLRNQLFEGILGRPWQRSRDYTGYYDERLKASPDMRENLAAVTLSLLQSAEYRQKLQTRVSAELADVLPATP